MHLWPALGFAIPLGLGIGSFLNVVIDRVPYADVVSHSPRWDGGR